MASTSHLHLLSITLYSKHFFQVGGEEAGGSGGGAGAVGGAAGGGAGAEAEVAREVMPFFGDKTHPSTVLWRKLHPCIIIYKRKLPLYHILENIHPCAIFWRENTPVHFL